MKTLYSRIPVYAALVMAGLCFIACDDISEDNRYILGASVKPERAVLLEDFTGQNCINCPDAHKVVEQLEEQYGSDKLIAVSIHSGSFGVSTSRTDYDRGRIGLMTEEGNALMEAYGIQSFPMGVINMGSPMVYDLWPTAVRNAFQVETDVNIDLTVAYTPSAQDGKDSGYTGKINIAAEIKSGSTRSANVQFWIVENNIVAAQRSTESTIPDYVHNNVFRGQVFNGLRGNQYSFTAGFPIDITTEIDNRWSSTEHWDINNLSVVAIVSDNTGVLQAARVSVIEKEENNNND